jgi:hypothetical protein
MNVTRWNFSLSGTTGDITSATSDVLMGRVLSIHLQYASATGTGFATTAAVAITSRTTGQTIWAETLTVLATTTVNIHRVPRQVTHSTVGTALTSTSGLVAEPIYLNENVVITATAIGSGTKAATLVINMD